MLIMNYSRVVHELETVGEMPGYAAASTGVTREGRSTSKANPEVDMYIGTNRNALDIRSIFEPAAALGQVVLTSGCAVAVV